jgi:predicted nucleic acid-binding protein
MNAGMRPLSLYLDSSVLGGYFDPVFEDRTRELWRLHQLGRFRFFSSQVVLEEIEGAPEHVRALLGATIAQEDFFTVSDEMESLAAAYMKAKVVPVKYVDDARHVAVCTAAKLDYLVSWNFKHLTNAWREAGFNAVNRLQGHPPVRIVAPTFLIHGQEKGT